MTAQRWGQTPSRSLGLSDDVVAYALDEALATRVEVEELRAAKDRPDKLPAGQRYATEADVSDWAEGDD